MKTKTFFELAALSVAFLASGELRADRFIFSDLSDAGSITHIGLLSTISSESGDGTEAITYSITRAGSTILSGGSIAGLSEPNSYHP